MSGSGENPKRRRTEAEQRARKQSKEPIADSSNIQQRRSHDDSNAWPRNHPFQLTQSLQQEDPHAYYNSDTYYLRPFYQPWNDIDSFFYNGLLNIEFKPTRMPNLSFFDHIEWLDSLKTLSDTLGLGSMLFKRHRFYPDLARQLIASCRVIYVNDRKRRAHEGSLHFKIDGIAYSVSFDKICDIFGFNKSATRRDIPIDSAANKALWAEITGLSYSTQRSKHSHIRHPVLRMFVKLISNTLLCTMEAGKMCRAELSLLNFAIGRHFDTGKRFDFSHDINFGAVFAHYIEKQKERGSLTPTQKTESIGSLLTPLLRLFDINFAGREDVRTKMEEIGEDTLKKGNQLAGDWGEFEYCHKDDTGVTKRLPLPSDWCKINNAQMLRFQPPPDAFVDPPPPPPSVPRRSIQRDAQAAGPSAPPPPEGAVPFDIGEFAWLSDRKLEDSIVYRKWIRITLRNMFAGIRHIARSCTARDDVVRCPSPVRIPRSYPPVSSDEELPEGEEEEEQGSDDYDE